MEYITYDKILLISIFFVPGFIYLKAYRLFFAETNTDFSKDLYEAIGFSFLNAIVFSYPLYLIHVTQLLSKHPLVYFLIVIFIVIIAPFLYAFIFQRISKKKWFSRFLVSPTKSAWDSFFSNRESYYVVVTLKSGRKIGGKYGLKSYSSTFPNPKEIYLQEVWKLNEKNGFENIMPQTEGILISESEISTIEFFI
jgi:hypothetical protein